VAAVICTIGNYREAPYGGFWKSQYLYSNTKISRSTNPMFFSRLNTHIYPPDKEAGSVHVTCFLARSVLADQRWDAGVGASGGQPGSNVTVGCSLDVDQRS
jgi:hypothetical protein